MNICTKGFQTVNQRLCRYYMNGFCLKGEPCFFSHVIPSSPSPCRNGPRCGYFANGVCRFFHRGVGVQQQRFDNQSEDRYESNPRMYGTNQKTNSTRWCYDMEDCVRVPNCSFSHYEQDFPPLEKNNPPQNVRNQRKLNAQNCQ